MTGTLLPKEDYIINELWKCNIQHSYDKLSKLVDRFSKIYNDKQFNKMKTERKDTETKVTQPTENMDIGNNEIPTHSTANKALNKKELHRQIQNQENIIKIRSAWISRKSDRLCYF